METKYYILMSFEQGQLVGNWHFKAATVSKLVNKMMAHLLATDKNASAAFEAVGYDLDDQTTPPTISIFLEVLHKIAELIDSWEESFYKLYEMETSHNGSALVEVKKSEIKPIEETQQTLKRKKRLRAGNGFLNFVPLWKEVIDLSLFEVNQSDFVMLWAKNLPRLWKLERDYFDEAVGRKQKKPVTVGVYFLEDDPVYIHRRSTFDTRYEWLVCVDKLNTYWKYEKKAWLEREHLKQRKVLTEFEKQEALALKEADKATREAIKQAAREKSEALEKEYQADKARIIEASKAKYEQLKQEYKAFKDECWYHANVWLYGHTPESKRNIEEWQLAEQEELELLNMDEHLNEKK